MKFKSFMKLIEWELHMLQFHAEKNDYWKRVEKQAVTEDAKEFASDSVKWHFEQWQNIVRYTVELARGAGLV